MSDKRYRAYCDLADILKNLMAIADCPETWRFYAKEILKDLKTYEEVRCYLNGHLISIRNVQDSISVTYINEDTVD